MAEWLALLPLTVTSTDIYIYIYTTSFLSKKKQQHISHQPTLSLNQPPSQQTHKPGSDVVDTGILFNFLKIC